MYFRDIKELKEDILSASSKREIIFYDYIRGNKINYNYSDEDDLVERVILSSLSKNNYDLASDINTIKQMKRKILDYRKNLITLIALGVYDYEAEENNIKEYLKGCSIRDSYLLSKSFKNIEFEYNKHIQNSLDKLVQEVLFKENYDKCEKLLYEALSEVSDIYELVIIEDVYKLIGSKLFADTGDYNRFIKNIEGLNKWIEFAVRIRLLIVFWIIISPIIYFSIKFITNNWDFSEPWVTTIQVILGIILGSFIFLGKALKINYIGDYFVEQKMKKIYMKHDEDYCEIRTLLDKSKKEND